jgi:F-type H+-transporting ATPase subunit a
MENKLNMLVRSLFAGIFAMFALLALPQSAQAAGGGEGEEFAPKDMILHHVLDDYGWHITEIDGHHISIPLPMILVVDGQLDIFMSSAFHHAPDGIHTTALGSYKLDHGHVVETNGKSVFDLSITKNVASMMLATVLLFAIFLPVASAYKKNPNAAPKGAQNLLETLVKFVVDDIMIPNIGEKKYKKYVPFVMTIFFFVWANNLLGLIPTGANASGNISFTLTLAFFTLIVTNLSGSKDYWGHIFWTPGVPLPLRAIMLPVEVLGIFTKPFALMIRLFANITAGHIIILSLISLIFLFKNAMLGLAVGPAVIALTMLELFVAALQAYIFSMLSALYIGLALEEHHHDEHH